MVKTVIIGDVEQEFRTDGALPRFYRKEFNRDLFSDLAVLNGTDQGKQIETIENMAYAMAKYADPEIGDIDEWLSQFGAFELIGAAGDILSILNVEQMTTSHAKKKSAK